jgi:hypothetical protein
MSHVVARWYTGGLAGTRLCHKGIAGNKLGIGGSRRTLLR